MISKLLPSILAAAMLMNLTYAQSPAVTNNLQHEAGYICSAYGSIPQYVKWGSGRKAIVLIPGLGFDNSIFLDLMKALGGQYTIYAITIPGYGNTQAPEMPRMDTSYGKQYWNSGVITGLLRLIEKEHLDKPVIAGHFVQGGQLAIRFAEDYPDKVSGVIVLGAPAKFITIVGGEPKEFPLESSIAYVDKYTAGKWFKTISKKDFDQGNYLPQVYSLDKDTADKEWNAIAANKLPVTIRYLCEFFASDVTLGIDQIKCPVLVLRPSFTKEILDLPVNNYIKPQFIDSWDKVAKKNPKIRFIDVEKAAAFVWKDNPDRTYSAIKAFMGSL